jgi:CheY-like chemotaxis protein
VKTPPLILIVDDNPTNLDILQARLEANNYEILTATDGEVAMIIAREKRPDLILLDIMMPKMDGYEVCSKLKENEETSFIPVIFVTALRDEQDKAKAFAVGAADYLVKPIQRDQLLNAVAKHLETRSRWNSFKKEVFLWDIAQPLNYTQFKDYLADQTDIWRTKPTFLRIKGKNYPGSRFLRFIL